MYIEKSLKEALEDYMLGRPVTVLRTGDDGGMNAMRLSDLLEQEENHYLVNVPAVANPEFEQAVREMKESAQPEREDAKDTNVPGKWILCSERLPEKPAVGEYGYLLRVACIVQLSAYWDGSKWIDAEDNVVFPFAWMPLPEPYRENEKNE